jgi:quercetin dioxygenase-like cupin family protein
MTITKFKEIRQDSLKPGWTRLSLSQAENFSVGYFSGLEVHPSASHQHDYEQLTIVLQGHLKVTGGDGTECRLSQGDCAYFAPHEEHHIEHSGEESAVRIDVFAPARSCDSWMTP